MRSFAPNTDSKNTSCSLTIAPNYRYEVINQGTLYHSTGFAYQLQQSRWDIARIACSTLLW